MAIADSLLMGVELMFLGMGTVFTFLVMLVFVLKGMSALAERLDDESHAVTSAVQQPPNHSPSASPAQADSTLVAVISAAVSKYRSNRN